MVSEHPQLERAIKPRVLARKTEGTIMNISDIRTRIESGTDEQSFLATRSEPNETPVLTLIDSPEPSEAEASVKPDPLIQALVDKLPRPDTVWSIDDRAKWLKAAAMAFNLVYRTDEGNEADLKIEKPSGLKSVS